MHQFTKSDIANIKDKVQHLIVSSLTFPDQLKEHIADNLLTEIQATDIANYIKKNYSTISYYPLPKELHPLIDVARHQLQEEYRQAEINRKARAKRRYSDDYRMSPAPYYGNSSWSDDSWNYNQY